MQYGCIGEHLGHSFSREIHARIADYAYELREVPREGLADFFKERDFRAVNVTIPYKQDVIPLLDYVDEKAREIGAVNTVVNREGKLCGYNTDLFGMQYLLTSIGGGVRGKKVLILGSGGTSGTAMTLCRDGGARAVIRVGRQAKPAEGVIDYATAYAEHADAEGLIDTTPVGMYPNCEGLSCDPAKFPHLTFVIDAVYNPLRTPLVEWARERGIPAAGGLAMLVAQAVRAAELFLDTSFPEGTLERVAREVLLSKEHIHLIGMPASGKTTVGKILSARLGRAFLDTDEVITAREGDIPAIFSTRGEAAFREIEAAAVRDTVFGSSGAVIATGGGVPLREDNLFALRRTGKIFWLDRSPELLTPTSDRPTASNRAAMEALYLARRDIYARACDYRIDGDGTPQEVADRILEAFR